MHEDPVLQAVWLNGTVVLPAPASLHDLNAPAFCAHLNEGILPCITLCHFQVQVHPEPMKG